MVTGLKTKFFLITFFSLLALSVSLLFLDRYILSKEVLARIDSELETIASSIVASGLSVDLLKNFEETDDLLRDALEDHRIDRTIRIFSIEGRLLFSNEMGSALESPLTQNRWSTIEYGAHQIRRLTIRAQSYFVEVGIVVQPLFSQLDKRLQEAAYIALIIFLVILTVSYFLSQKLVEPLEDINQFVSTLYNPKDNRLAFETIANKTIPLNLEKIASRPDEVGRLAKKIIELLQKIDSSMRSYEENLYFLTHEFKTPLARIVVEAEQEATTSNKNILKICKDLSHFVDDFIRISYLKAKDKNDLTLQQIQVNEIAKEVIEQLDSDAQRIILVEKATLQLTSEKTHLHSVLSNLIVNSLKYSPGKVQVIVDTKCIHVKDEGKGLSQEIESHLGKMFNRSNDKNSNGLGLAFVISVCKIYGWRFKYFREGLHSVFQIDFF